MPTDAPSLIPRKINLAESINTDSPDYDIRPLDGGAAHRINTGIERNGGIKSAYQKIYAQSSGVAVQYTKSGKRVEFNTSTGAVSIDGVSIGSTSATGVQLNEEVPGEPLDVIPCSSGNAVIVLTSTSLEYWSSSGGVWTRDDAQTIAHGVTYSSYLSLKMVRRHDATVTATSSIGYVIGQNTSYQLVVIAVAGSTLFSITTPAAPIKYSAVYASADTVYVFQLDQASPNSWTWSSTGPTLTAFAGYGFPLIQPGSVGGIATRNIAIYRTPVVGSAVVAKYFQPSSGTPTTATDVSLAYTPTAIYYSRVTFGAIFCSYAHSGGDQTDVVNSIGDITRTYLPIIRGINALRSYQTELVGQVANFVGIYTINGSPAYLGYYVPGSTGTVGSARHRYGALYSTVGEIDPEDLPTVSGNNIVYRTAYGKFRRVFLATAFDGRLQLVAPEIVSINTVRADNVVDVKNKKILVGPNAYNGTMIVAVPYASPGSPYTINSRLVSQYGSGVDTGEKALINVGTLAANRFYFPTGDDFRQAADTDFDIYENSDYIGTITGGGATGALTTKPDLVDTVYLQGIGLPPRSPFLVTVAGLSSDGVVALRRGQELMYDIGNELPRSGNIFTLFGTPYLYDGETIWVIEKTANGGLAGIAEVARADGLTYLALTPTAAWFLSAWDNSLWSFDGGRNAEKKIRLNAKGAILGAAYCTPANELSLYLGSGVVVYLRDGVLTQTTLGATATGTLSMQPTNEGTWIVPQLGAGNIAMLTHNSTGATTLGLDFATAYQGFGLNKKARPIEYVFTLYDPARAAMSIAITWSAFDEGRQFVNETKTITPAWDSAGIASISFIPNYCNVLAASIRLTTSSAVTLLDAVQYVEDNGERGVIETR